MPDRNTRTALFAFAALVAMGAPALAAPAEQAAAAAAKPTLQIVSFTGQVQIKMASGEVIGIVPGAAVPDIPAGAEIIVVSGEAVFKSGDTAIKAEAGDSFTFNATAPGAGQAGPQVQIAATGDKSEVKVTVGKTEATVGKGDVLQVSVTGAGKAEVQALNGQVEVSVNGQSTTLAQGQTQTADTPTTTTQPAATTTTQASTTETQPTTTEGGTSETTTETTTETSTTSNEPPPPPPPNPAQETSTASASTPS